MVLDRTKNIDENKQFQGIALFFNMLENYLKLFKIYSKLFFPRKEADTEIAYLEKKFGTKLKYFPDLGAIRYLEEKGLAYKRPNYIIPTYIGVIKLMEGIMKKENFQTKENYLRIIDYYHGLYFYNPTAEIHSAMLSLQREYEQKYPRGKGET